MPSQKNDPPDYSVSGESTRGALVIRRVPLLECYHVFGSAPEDFPPMFPCVLTSAKPPESVSI